MAAEAVSAYGEEADRAVGVSFVHVVWYAIFILGYCSRPFVRCRRQSTPFASPWSPCLVIIIALITPLSTLGLLLRPIQPTTLIIPQILIPRLARQLTRRRAPLARSAEEDHLLLGQRLGEGVFGLERARVVGR